MVLTIEAIAALRALFFGDSGRSTPADDLDDFLGYMRKLYLPRAPYHDICIPKILRLQVTETPQEVAEIHYHRVRFYPGIDSFGSLGWRVAGGSI